MATAIHPVNIHAF